MCEERKCINCKYMRTSYSEEPCKSCDRMCRSNWVDASESKPNIFPRACSNCKYLDRRIIDEPCLHCANGSKWVDASIKGTTFNTTVPTDNKFKVGDLVVMKNDMGVKTIYIYLGDNWALRVPNYVLARSECNYVFSNYVYALINGNLAVHASNIEYASHEDITEHDKRVKRFYIPETLNEWFYKIIGRTPEKKPVTKITVHHMGEVRYDKYPTLNANFIKRVIFSDPATIVFWEDGTKTVVKTQDGEKYDKEKGLAMAIAKRVFGNERDYYHVFKRWMRKGEERHEET